MIKPQEQPASEKVYVKKLISKMTITGVALHSMYLFSGYIGINKILSDLILRMKEKEEQKKRDEERAKELARYKLGNGLVSFYYNDPIDAESGDLLQNGFDLPEIGEYNTSTLARLVNFKSDEITQVELHEDDIEVQVFADANFEGPNAIIRLSDGLVNLKK